MRRKGVRYIPKVIHLIWFGGNSYSDVVKKCIKSWEIFCPDYSIKIWNEDNFDINYNSYVREAYEAKKWAFVSDYVRLFALYYEGGVYIDSDVELLKGIDDILENRHVVTGYSSSNWIPTGFMASEKGNIWIKELLDYYDGRHFIKEDGSLDMKVNNVIITEISKRKFGFKVGDMSIEKGNVSLFPQPYFHPFHRRAFDYKKVAPEIAKKYFNTTKDTYCIHYGTATWVQNRNSFGYKIKHLVRMILPQRIMEPVERAYYKIHRWTE